MHQFSSPSQPSVQSPPWLEAIDRGAGGFIGLGLLIAAILLLTVGLGDSPLRDWDEGLVAQVAKEIANAPFQDNIWLHPTLQGEPYFNKPPFVHWWVAIAYKVGGINEWMARLPGALATALSVYFLYQLGRELFPQRITAFFSACTYLTLLPVVRHGRLAMLDGMVLCAFLSLLICVLRSRHSPRWSLGIGVSLGILVLTKGVIAVPLMTIALLFVAWDAPRLLRSPLWWGGIGLGTLPGLLWYAAQGFHYGQPFWDAHLFQQSLNRVSQTVEQHSGPPWYYGVELLKYSWPWLLFLPMGIATTWQNRALSWAKLMGIWGLGYFGLISVMGTKLPWYIMPLYPVLALVIGVELHRLWQTLSGESPRLRPSSAYQWLLLGMLILLALVGWGGLGYFSGVFFSDQTDWSLAMPLGVLGLTMTLAVVLLGRSDRQFISILLWGFYCCLILFVSSPHWNWELGEEYPVKPVASMIQRAMGQTDLLKSNGSSTHEEPVSSRSNLLNSEASTIFTSHPYKRPSLDFYSGYNIKPVGLKKLEQRWKKEPSTILLLDKRALDKLSLKRMSVLGQHEDWYLVQRKRKTPGKSKTTQP